jgi:hypothetical protein
MLMTRRAYGSRCAVWRPKAGRIGDNSAVMWISDEVVDKPAASDGDVGAIFRRLRDTYRVART